VVELPGVADEGGVRSLLQTTARLEFKLVRNDQSTAKFFGRIDKMLAGKITSLDTVATKDTNTVDADSSNGDSTDKRTADATDTNSKPSAGDTTGKRADSGKGKTAGDTTKDTSGNPYANLPEAEQAKAYQKDHPFTTLFLTQVQLDPEGKPQEIAYLSDDLPVGDYYFLVPRKTRDQIKAVLSRTDVRAAMPEDIVIAFSADAEFPATGQDPENDLFALYAVTRETELTGEVITDAYPSFDPQGRPMVLMQMNSDGADRWAAITGKNLKKRVAIVLDSAVYSAPVVQSKIPNGSSQITGSGDAKEANLLAVVLKAGALKAPIRIIEERVVGPSLGQDSINKGVFSTLVATALVFLFMVFYYRYAGLVADAALMMNILITVALLAAFQATLTLPGIGGLVLTIGMAVDGNILIYERIREELAAGRPLAKAIQVGYDKAWSAVLDTHITTLISGAILYFFGSGPVQGFAITLMIGLVATFFTAVFVTRTVFMLNIERGADTINFGQDRVNSGDASKRVSLDTP
ncbi:MAG: protein translocase subunit SecD, partial [bacterium]|nr:protein translocase subunit SecD [Candidatus Kapabacteria bacterium]